MQTRAGTQTPVTCFCSKNNRAFGSLPTELVRDMPFRRTASFGHTASCQDSWPAGPLQTLSHPLKKTEWKFPGHSRESGMSSLRSLGGRADLDNSVLSLAVLTEKTHGIVCVFLSSELARVAVCGSQADPSRCGQGPTSTSTARHLQSVPVGLQSGPLSGTCRLWLNALVSVESRTPRPAAGPAECP